MSSLKSLNLSRNPITLTGFKTIGHAFAFTHCKSDLERRRLFGSIGLLNIGLSAIPNMHSQAADFLFFGFRNFNRVRKLDLSDNVGCLSDKNEKLLQMLEVNTNLRHLNFNNCRIGDSGAD